MSDRPLVVILKHGLGNLLFEYAAGRTFAGLLDRPLAFAEATPGRLHALEDALGERLPRAGVPALVAAGCVPWSAPVPVRVVAHAVRDVTRGRRLSSTYGPTAVPGEVQHVRCVNGLHQDLRYVEPSLPEVQRLLAASFATELRESPVAEDVVAVNLRRGDYVNIGWALPDAYYERALREVHAAGLRRALVLSDDRWAARGFERHVEALGFEIVDAGSSASVSRATAERDDFARLAGARHLIMSNSTFTWWAAALGDHLWDGQARTVWFPGGWLNKRPERNLCRAGWRSTEAWT